MSMLPSGRRATRRKRLAFNPPLAAEEKNAGSARTRAVGRSCLAVTPAAALVRDEARVIWHVKQVLSVPRGSLYRITLTLHYSPCP